MRIAFIDLTFHWPATGGSWIDTYEVMTRLQAKGHDVALFVPRFQYGFVPRGEIKDELPFPVFTLPFTPSQFNWKTAPQRFHDEVMEWQPDVVMVGDAYTMKPWIGLAFKEVPVIQRFFGHEMICPNYIGMIRHGEICKTHFLRTPGYCTQCAIRMMRWSWVHNGMDEFIHEYITGLGFAPFYKHIIVKSLQRAAGIIVYNQWSREEFYYYNHNTQVIPGGVDTKLYHPATEVPNRSDDSRMVIFMSGRVHDPRKGAGIVREAAEILSKRRNDFRILFTDPNKFEDGIYSSTGWLNREQLAEAYRQSDIAVIPSQWHEPFGLVTLEAMASGIPVVGTAVGGINDTIRHGYNGFKFPFGRADILAEQLGYLMDNPGLRKSMGYNGRMLADTLYTWESIIENHYIPLLTQVVEDFKKQ